MPINAPRTLIEQNIPDEAPPAEDNALIAFVVGPDYAVRKYSDDKDSVALGTYLDADLAVNWPNRGAGEEVDFDFTRAFMENARLEYFEDLVGAGDVYAPVGGTTNQIVATANIFATGNGFTRSATIPTDVKAGDHVRLTTSPGGDILDTFVKAVVAEIIDDVIAAPVASGSNEATQAAADNVTADVGNTGSIGSESVDGSSYDGRVDDQISETYTITVTQASTGGDHTTAIFDVVSASGTDDQTGQAPSASGVATAIGTRGLTVTWTGGDFAIGDEWVATVDQAYTVPAVASAGDYVGTVDTIYRVRVTRGGDMTGNTLTGAAIEVTTLNGIDASGPHYPVADTPLAIGTLGVTVTFDSSGTSDLVTGDVWTVDADAETEGQLNRLALTNDLPATHSGEADFDLRISIVKDIEVSENRLSAPPLVNFEQSATQITLKAGILSSDARVVDGGGNLVDLAVWYGEAFVTYRALKTVSANILNSLTAGGSAAGAVTDFFGTTDSDAVLPFGVLKALEAAGGSEVRFISVESDDLAGYTTALQAVTEVNVGHGLVPLTNDQDVRLLFRSTALSRSSSEEAKWSVAWLGQNLVTEEAVLTADEDGFELQATVVDDPGSSGTQYTLVNDPGGEGQFISNDVLPGDEFRTQYSTDGFGNETYESYTIDQVLTEESLLLISGPSAEISLASKYEIHRPLPIASQADEYIDRASALSHRRVRVVFPANPKIAGVSYPNYFLAATLAGLRSSVEPHAPLSNVAVPGWDDMSEAAITFSNQLNNLLNGGLWIVTQEIGISGVTGAPFTYRQVTTDLSDLRNLEDSIVANGDSIALQIKRAFEGVTGKTNIWPGTLDKISNQLNAVLESLGEVTDEDIGPQVIDYEILELRQHEIFRDRVFAQVEVLIPTPLNELQIQLDLVL